MPEILVQGKNQVVFLRKKISVALYKNTFFRSKRYCHNCLFFRLEDQQGANWDGKYPSH